MALGKLQRQPFALKGIISEKQCLLSMMTFFAVALDKLSRKERMDTYVIAYLNMDVPLSRAQVGEVTMQASPLRGSGVSLALLNIPLQTVVGKGKLLPYVHWVIQQWYR